MDLAQLSRIHHHNPDVPKPPAGGESPRPQDGSNASKVRMGMAANIALIALATGQFLVGLDLSVMSVALPTIQKEFGVGMIQMEWAMMAYMVAGAALAVPAGALGDRTGRRRLYLIGTSIFVAGSAISASRWFWNRAAGVASHRSASGSVTDSTGVFNDSERPVDTGLRLASRSGRI